MKVLVTGAAGFIDLLLPRPPLGFGVDGFAALDGFCTSTPMKLIVSGQQFLKSAAL